MSVPLESLEGRVVVVTGAHMGLGAAVVRALSERGAVVEEVDAGDAAAHLRDVAARRGRVDAAVLAHAWFPRAASDLVPVGSLDVEALRGVLADDVGTTVECLAALAPVMAARRNGAVVVVAGTLAQRGFPGMGAVTASRHALLGLVQATAREWSATGLRICAACPGMVESAELRALVGPRMPLLPVTPVAAMIALLCSDAASAVSGSAVLMDGGASGF